MRKAIFLSSLALAIPLFAQVGQHASYKLLVDKDNGIVIYLPDSTYTPGAVRTTDVKEVCSETTKQFRTSTKRMRDEAYREYQVEKGSGQRYEVDDLIALELGGANVVPNFWPQPYPQAYWKDQVENWEHKKICGEFAAGDVATAQADLIIAQHAIAENWYFLYTEMNNSPKPIEKPDEQKKPTSAALQ